MTLPTSRNAYRAYYDLLDRALSSEKGIRIRVTDRGAANQMRVRLHTARSLARDLSREAYDIGHPKHGISAYDELVVRIQNNADDIVVVIEPTSAIGEIEEIA